MADLSCIQRRYPTLGEGNQSHSCGIPHASGLVRVVRIVILSVEVPAFKLCLPDDFPESIDTATSAGSMAFTVSSSVETRETVSCIGNMLCYLL